MYLTQFTQLLWLLAILTCFGVAGCGKTTPETAKTESPTAGSTAAPSASSATPPASAKTESDPQIILHTSAGDIKVRLFAKQAPQTVDNFLTAYADRGFYEQTIFHHVEPGMMLIGGGFTADFQAKATRTAIYNESRNGLSNRRGTVAMIRESDAPHSATSQFFINLADNPQFDFQAGEPEDTWGYCVFGEVVEGMDVVTRIAQSPATAHAEFAKVPSPTPIISSVERLR